MADAARGMVRELVCISAGALHVSGRRSGVAALRREVGRPLVGVVSSGAEMDGARGRLSVVAVGLTAAFSGVAAGAVSMEALPDHVRFAEGHSVAVEREVTVSEEELTALER